MPRADRLFLLVALAAAPSAYSPADAACTISSTGVAYGSYNPQSGSNTDGMGTIDVGCHPSDGAPTVALSAGSSGSFSPRTMKNGGWTLTYNLYSDSGRTIIWGDGTSGTVTVTLTGGSVSAGVRRYTRTVYGRIPGLQNVGAGPYNDTIILTVTF